MRIIFVFLVTAFALFGHDSAIFDIGSLELSEKQEVELKRLFKEYKKESKKRYKEAHKLHEDKERLLKSQKFDAIAFAKLEEEECRLKTAGHASFWERAHEILSQKQVEKLYEIYEKSGRW